MKIILQATSPLQTAVTDMLSKTMAILPNIATAIVILIIGLLVAKLLAGMIKKLLKAAKIDALGESLNRIDIISKANMKIELSSIFSKTVYYFLLLIVLILASSALNMPEVTNLISDIFKFIPKLLVAFIILILGTLLADVVKNMIHTALKSLGVPSAGMISSVFFYFLFINVVISALTQAEIKTDFLAQNISILLGGIILAFAIGYGLASKDTMSNLLASFYVKNSLKVGDKVTIDGITGTIAEVDKSKLTIETADSMVMMPLSKANTATIHFHKN